MYVLWHTDQICVDIPSYFPPSRPFTAQLCNVQVVTAESEAPGRHGGFDDYTERTIDLY